MRPLSYYTTIANNNSSEPSSQSQFRSSISSRSSSSYASQTHLPFAAQTALVAHCFTGVGSSTKPYINNSSSWRSMGTPSSGAWKGHFARSYTTSNYSHHPHHSRRPSAYSRHWSPSYAPSHLSPYGSSVYAGYTRTA